jgi:hypothetical protein
VPTQPFPHKDPWALDAVQFARSLAASSQGGEGGENFKQMASKKIPNTFSHGKEYTVFIFQVIFS